MESVINFRDLGGYRTRDGRGIVWRRIFRSGELGNINQADFSRLTDEIALSSVLDLRGAAETERFDTSFLLEAGIRYHNIPFMTEAGVREKENRLSSQISNMGEFYLHLVRDRQFGERIIEALEIIAEPANQPLVFHCAIGKDRTGILAAVLLNILGVEKESIIEDYCLSAPYMVEFLKEVKKDPEMATFIDRHPDFFWTAVPESMSLFLNTLQEEYGSVREYLEKHGAGASLVERLEAALLV